MGFSKTERMRCELKMKGKCRSVKRRVTGKRRVAGEKMDSASRLRIFAGYEILQAAKFRRVRNFATCEFLQVAKIFTT